MIPLLGVTLGMWVGVMLNSIFEWTDAIRYGPFEITSHLMAWIIFVIPNTIFVGGILYAVAAKTRSTLYPFVAAAALLVLYGLSRSWLGDIEYDTISSYLDPFGAKTFSVATKYWTVAEKNTTVMGLTGILLLNRIIWMAVGFDLIIYWLPYF